MGPQRYTVVAVPSGTLVSIRYLLYLLYYKRIFVMGAKGRAIEILYSRGTFLVTLSSRRVGGRTFADL
jgi:hypothetical protein